MDASGGSGWGESLVHAMLFQDVIHETTKLSNHPNTTELWEGFWRKANAILKYDKPEGPGTVNL